MLPLFSAGLSDVVALWVESPAYQSLKKAGFENDTRKTKYLHLFLWDFVLQDLEDQDDLCAAEFVMLTLCKGFTFFAAW